MERATKPGCLRKSRSALVCFTLALWLIETAVAAAQERIPRVLLLYPYDNTGAAIISGEAARRRLIERLDRKVEFHTDFLDLLRFQDEAYRQRAAQYLAQKYAQTSIDLIIALNTETYRFVRAYRDLFAPKVPVVFCCVMRSLLDETADRPADITGIITDYDITKTLELAQRLQPNARNLVFVGGASEIDRGWLEMYRRQAAPYQSRFTIKFLGGLPHDELLRQVAQLPRDSIVMLGTLFVDGAGRQFVSYEVAADVAKASSAPTYAPIDTYLGRGIVGGHMGTFEDAGIEVADLALKVLAGADIRTIPPQSSQAQRFRVDARQLERWTMAEKSLPPDTFIAFKEPTLWEQHRDTVIAATAIIAVQAALITMLLVQILKRRRVEASLKESEGRWRSVFETSTVGIALAGHDMRYLAANGAFQDMLGYTDEELRRLSPLDIAIADNREAARNMREEFKDGRREHHETIRQYRRRDNVPIWVHEYVSMIPGNDGKPHFYLETAIDITDRKRAEHAMEVAQSELARVTRTTTMGEMTASIAHEVNQPLAAIVANGNAGLRWLTNAAPNLDEAKSAFKRIVNDGHRASEVISTIRAMFKKDAQSKAWVDLSQLVREVLALLNSQINTQGVSVRNSLADELPPVWADRVQLQQVVLNLVMNAIEAMASVTDRERTLSIRAEVRKPSAVLLSIADTGPSIEADNLERIFEAFYTTKVHGMGMGLSICRSIIEAHGGRLSAMRSHPHGSVFQAVLPNNNRD